MFRIIALLMGNAIIPLEALAVMLVGLVGLIWFSIYKIYQTKTLKYIIQEERRTVQEEEAD